MPIKQQCSLVGAEGMNGYVGERMKDDLDERLMS
jgi:hypothetical protein